jgi:hypothetical protein
VRIAGKDGGYDPGLIPAFTHSGHSSQSMRWFSLATLEY